VSDPITARIDRTPAMRAKPTKRKLVLDGSNRISGQALIEVEDMDTILTAVLGGGIRKHPSNTPLIPAKAGTSGGFGR
jgi:hypothetical protein